MAARNSQTEQGDMLVLWVRLPDNEIEIEFDFGDEDDYLDEDDDFDLE